MIQTPKTQRDTQVRVYERAKSVVFLKTTEEFGGLSNMAGGFPLKVNGLRILTSEALYQACRFPHIPDVQRLIIAQTSPMTAKMKGKPYRRDSRPDWNQVRVKIMRWCLRVKLAQNWTKFSELLLATGNYPIVESSRKDEFWGAKPADDRTLVGRNVLGRLLMELREEVRSGVLGAPMCVEPVAIPAFLLDGQQIQPVVGSSESESRKSALSQERRIMTPGPSALSVQISMFDRMLDASDVPTQLAELRLLRDGWLDGSGRAPSSAGLDWLSREFTRSYPDDLPLPLVYPTPEGGIRLEWSLGSNDVTVDLHLVTHVATVHVLNLDSDEEQEERIHLLDQPAEWEGLIGQIRRLLGASA